VRSESLKRALKRRKAVAPLHKGRVFAISDSLLYRGGSFICSLLHFVRKKEREDGRERESLRMDTGGRKGCLREIVKLVASIGSEMENEIDCVPKSVSVIEMILSVTRLGNFWKVFLVANLITNVA